VHTFQLDELSAVTFPSLRQLTAGSCESTGFPFFLLKHFRWLTAFFLFPLNYREQRLSVVNERVSGSPKPPKPEILTFS
jgi:hypothetical protein